MQVKDRLLNLDNVDYIDVDSGKSHAVKIFFNGSGTMNFTGDEAEQLREYLKELDVVDRMPFFS